MRIPVEVVERLTQLNLLGIDRQTSVPIKQLKTLKSAEKSINSKSWENYCLDKRGDVTSYLFFNEGDKYKEWNDLVDEVVESIIPQLKNSLVLLVDEKKLLPSMLNQIIFDITCLAVFLTYKKECPNLTSEFYDSVEELYFSGFIPCGYSRGKYKVL